MGVLNRITGSKPVALSYQDFWKWFIKNEKKFHQAVKNGESEQQFFGKLAPKLAAVKEDIFYLAGMDDDQTAELIITADGSPKNIIFVEELMAEAPTLPGWKLTTHKPVLPIEDVNIEMDGYKFNKSNVQFYASALKDYPDEISITIVY